VKSGGSVAGENKLVAKKKAGGNISWRNRIGESWRIEE